MERRKQKKTKNKKKKEEKQITIPFTKLFISTIS